MEYKRTKTLYCESKSQKRKNLKHAERIIYQTVMSILKSVTMGVRKMEITEIQVYAYQNNQWIKTETFTPNDMVCWLIPERTDIWVWEGPMVSEKVKKQGLASLMKWKDHKLGYVFHSCNGGISMWKKPKKIARQCDLAQKNLIALRQKFTPKARIPRKNLKWIEGLNWIATLAVLALIFFAIPISIRNPTGEIYNFVYPSKAMFILRWQLMFTLAIVLLGLVSMELIISHHYRYYPTNWYAWIKVAALIYLIFGNWIIGITQIFATQSYTIGALNQIIVETNDYLDLFIYTACIFLLVLFTNVWNLIKIIRDLRKSK